MFGNLSGPVFLLLLAALAALVIVLITWLVIRSGKRSKQSEAELQRAFEAGISVGQRDENQRSSL